MRYACAGCRFETDDVYQALEHTGIHMGALVLATRTPPLTSRANGPILSQSATKPATDKDDKMTRTDLQPQTYLYNATVKVKSGDRQHGWLEVRATFQGADYLMQAQIFAEPSDYGILAGRISRLSIVLLGDFVPLLGNPDTKKRSRTQIYSYDRGLDYDHTPTGLLHATLGYLEGR